MMVDGHAGESGHGLALRAGDDDADLLRRGRHDVLGAEQDVVGQVQQSEVVGDLRGGVHAAAEEGDFSTELRREINDLLEAVNRRAEARDDQAAFGAIECPRNAGNRALAFRVSGPIDVGGIRQEQQNAAVAVVG